MMELSFEQALARLEAIVETMENEQTTLDASMELYREGINLSKQCASLLNRYESDIVQLQQDAEGLFVLKPFERA